MNDYSRLPLAPKGEEERSRRGLPIALTLIILAVGAMGLIKFQEKKEQKRQSTPTEEFVPGIYEGKQELWVQPLDRPQERALITYSFEYSAQPSYGGNETISKRMQVFEKQAISFLRPMKKRDFASPGAKEMLQSALFTVLESALFPRSRGRLTEFHIHKVHVDGN